MTTERPVLKARMGSPAAAKALIDKSASAEAVRPEICASKWGGEENKGCLKDRRAPVAILQKWGSGRTSQSNERNQPPLLEEAESPHSFPQLPKAMLSAPPNSNSMTLC